MPWFHTLSQYTTHRQYKGQSQCKIAAIHWLPNDPINKLKHPCHSGAIIISLTMRSSSLTLPRPPFETKFSRLAAGAIGHIARLLDDFRSNVQMFTAFEGQFTN